MSNPSIVIQAADRLVEAERTRVACPPIRDLFDPADVDTAYRIQEEITRRGVGSGRRVIGRKIGLTNPVVQAQLGVDQPDFGTLFADMAFPSGVELPPDRLIQPRGEAEIALVLGSGLDRTDNSIVDLLGAIDHAVAALEIVDSRVSGWDIRITDTVADNGSSGLFVVGSQPVPLSEVDLRQVEMTMTVNGETVSEGSGAACLDNPLNAALWLANEVARRGFPLAAGDVILTGALGPMRPLAPGDEVVAHLTGLGTVACRLAEEKS
jgi:2-keto-4-pentenoate hydratase